MLKKYAKGIFCVILAIILTSVSIAGSDVYAASKPGKPVFSVAKRNKKSAVLKIKKVKNATGYQVFLSNSKNGKYQQVAASRKNSVKLLKLKKNKVYYVKVRAFRTVGYRITLGKFSKVQKIDKYGKKKEEPDETPMPEGSPNPDETPMPEGSPNPDGTPMPEGSPNPDETPMPEGSPNPDGTPMPEGSPNPDGTPMPEGSPNPDGTSVPDGMQMPENTIVP